MTNWGVKPGPLCGKEWCEAHKNDTAKKIDFMTITDTVTGETLSVVRLSLEQDFVVVCNEGEAETVKKRSVGKVIREWMEERKKEIG